MTIARKHPPHPYKQRAVLALKFIFISGLLYFLLKKGFISVEATRQALKEWQIILPAVGALLFTTCLGVVRWKWLLNAQGIQIPFLRIMQLTFIGNFFNIALPGAVSGDFVKVFYVGKEAKGQKTRALGSILFDRVAGLSALVLVSSGALIINYEAYANTPLLKAIQVLVEIAAASVVFFYGYLFLVRERHDPLLRLLRWLESQISKASALTRVYLSLRHYHTHRIAVLKVLSISVLIHLIVGWSCLQLAYALGETQIALLSLYVILGMGLLITAIPIAPGGIGTGNVAFLYLFHLIGSERGADVYSLFAMVNLFIGSIGGLVYLRFRSHESAPDLKLAEA
ncbi:MAG: lysylphosphatidylglycerol synthase transmembrane domain-containing protein [Bdellovibrionia bacterium]